MPRVGEIVRCLDHGYWGDVTFHSNKRFRVTSSDGVKVSLVHVSRADVVLAAMPLAIFSKHFSWTYAQTADRKQGATVDVPIALLGWQSMRDASWWSTTIGRTTAYALVGMCDFYADNETPEAAAAKDTRAALKKIDAYRSQDVLGKRRGLVNEDYLTVQHMEQLVETQGGTLAECVCVHPGCEESISVHGRDKHRATVDRDQNDWAHLVSNCTRLLCQPCNSNRRKEPTAAGGGTWDAASEREALDGADAAPSLQAQRVATNLATILEDVEMCEI